MSEPVPSATEGRETLAPQLKGRSLAFGFWVLAGSGLILAGLLNGAVEKLTLEYAIVGFIGGAWFGALFAFITLLPKEGSNALGREPKAESVLGIGSRPFGSIAVAVVFLVVIANEYSVFPVGPIDAVSFVTAWALTLAAMYIDMWVATPRRLSGAKFDPTRINDGGQIGLVDRSNAVAYWLVPLAVISTCWLFIVGLVEVVTVNFQDGFIAGATIGVTIFATTMFSTLRTYDDRVRRRARFLDRSKPFKAIAIGLRWVVAIGAIVLLIAALGFCAGMFAAMVATACGLAATIIDRWIIAPRKMDRGGQSPTSTAVAA